MHVPSPLGVVPTGQSAIFPEYVETADAVLEEDELEELEDEDELEDVTGAV